MQKLAPAERSEESYAKLEKMYSGAYAQRVPERVDPAETRARQDPLFVAKKVTEDLMRLFELSCEEYKLSPAEMVFVSELVRLNVQRAQDCPLTPEQIERVAAKARTYYESVVAAL